MCKLFVNSDPSLWQNVTRSLRIDGMVTSIRLESFFWFTLEEIAQRDKLSLSQMIAKLNHEALDAGHDLDNFTSFCEFVPCVICICKPLACCLTPMK